MILSSGDVQRERKSGRYKPKKVNKKSSILAKKRRAKRRRK